MKNIERRPKPMSTTLTIIPVVIKPYYSYLMLKETDNSHISLMTATIKDNQDPIETASHIPLKKRVSPTSEPSSNSTLSFLKTIPTKLSFSTSMTPIRITTVTVGLKAMTSNHSLSLTTTMLFQTHLFTQQPYFSKKIIF